MTYGSSVLRLVTDGLTIATHDTVDLVARTGNHRTPLVKSGGQDREYVLYSVGALAPSLAHEKSHGVGLVEKS